jgi:hypothetical protein
MKSFRKELWFNIPSRGGFDNITPEGDSFPSPEIT